MAQNWSLSENALSCLKHQVEKIYVSFLVVKEDLQPLLAYSSSQDLGLVVLNTTHGVDTHPVDGSINQIRDAGSTLSEESIMDKYKDVFTGMGCLERPNPIEIDPTVKTVFHAAHRI